MTSKADLINEINSQIGRAASLSPRTSGASNDVYEAYVWSLMIVAAQQEGATIEIAKADGTPTANLKFRNSPGSIFSTTHDYTHANIRFADCPTLEVHIGIRALGVSKILHECDVAVVEASEAETCRVQQVHPRAAKILLVAECKFYSTPIPLGLGRGFLGLTKEFHLQNRYLVANSQFGNAFRLANHHKAEWECDVRPSHQNALNLIASIARVFRNYKMSN